MNGRDRGGFQRRLESERRIGFGAVEGRVAGVAILCAALLSEPMQLAEVMPLDGLGEVSQISRAS